MSALTTAEKRREKKAALSAAPSSLQHREAYERMNFLHQAARDSATKGNAALCRHYVASLRAIARRLVLRL